MTSAVHDLHVQGSAGEAASDSEYSKLALIDEQISKLVEDQQQREEIYTALITYQRGQDLFRLLAALRGCISSPDQLQLYDLFRPVVGLGHQLQYSLLSAPRPSSRGRVISLWRLGGDSFGFRVRGGFEYNIGFYVTHVERDSQAYARGLRIGDELLQVNGYTLTWCTGPELLHLIKDLTQIEIRVRKVGLVPSKEGKKVEWTYSEVLDNLIAERSRPVDGQTVRIFINVANAGSLGCSISLGPRSSGIFIQSVRPGGLTDEAGVEVGDQILSVNGYDLTSASHKQAVMALKSNRTLHMTIKKGVGRHLFADPDIEWDEQQTKDREKARELRELATHQAQSKHSAQIHSEIDEVSNQRSSGSSARRNSRDASNASAGLSNLSINTETAKTEFEERQARLLHEHQREQIARHEREEQEREIHRKHNENGEKWAQKKSVSEEIGDYASIDITSLTPEASEDDSSVQEVVIASFSKEAIDDFEIEGGSDSPLDKIVISDIFSGGLIHGHGNIHVGDELSSVNNMKMRGLTLNDAKKVLRNASTSAEVSMTFIKADSRDWDDQVTYL